MAKWADDKCCYCDYSASDLDRYECPECKRTGCVNCMPTGNESPCNQCVERKEFEENAGMRRV